MFARDAATLQEGGDPSDIVGEQIGTPKCDGIREVREMIENILPATLLSGRPPGSPPVRVTCVQDRDGLLGERRRRQRNGACRAAVVDEGGLGRLQIPRRCLAT